jgi:hypothetical protein
MSISDKKKGKSAGARIITCIRIFKETFYLLSIYDKSEQVDISKSEIENLIGYVKGT